MAPHGPPPNLPMNVWLRIIAIADDLRSGELYIFLNKESIDLKKKKAYHIPKPTTRTFMQVSRRFRQRVMSTPERFDILLYFSVRDPLRTAYCAMSSHEEILNIIASSYPADIHIIFIHPVGTAADPNYIDRVFKLISRCRARWRSIIGRGMDPTSVGCINWQLGKVPTPRCLRLLSLDERVSERPLGLPFGSDEDFTINEFPALQELNLKIFSSILGSVSPLDALRSLSLEIGIKSRSDLMRLLGQCPMLENVLLKVRPVGPRSGIYRNLRSSYTPFSKLRNLTWIGDGEEAFRFFSIIQFSALEDLTISDDQESFMPIASTSGIISFPSLRALSLGGNMTRNTWTFLRRLSLYPFRTLSINVYDLISDGPIKLEQLQEITLKFTSGTCIAAIHLLQTIHIPNVQEMTIIEDSRGRPSYFPLHHPSHRITFPSLTKLTTRCLSISSLNDLFEHLWMSLSCLALLWPEHSDGSQPPLVTELQQFLSRHGAKLREITRLHLTMPRDGVEKAFIFNWFPYVEQLVIHLQPPIDIQAQLYHSLPLLALSPRTESEYPFRVLTTPMPMLHTLTIMTPSFFNIEPLWTGYADLLECNIVSAIQARTSAGLPISKLRLGRNVPESFMEEVRSRLSDVQVVRAL